MELVQSKELSEKEKKNTSIKSKNQRRKERRRDKCKQCEDNNFSSNQAEFCEKCKHFLEGSIKCHLCTKKHYRKKNEDGCLKCNKGEDSTKVTSTPTTTESTTSTTTTTTTTTIATTTQEINTTQEPMTSSVSPNALRKSCRNAVFRRSNRDTCKQALDKCRNKMYRTGNIDKCKEEDGDRDWLQKKCAMENFLDKNKKTCQRLCSDNAYKKVNEHICRSTADVGTLDTVTQEENGESEPKQGDARFESLEELVKKCGNKGYKKRNGDKCKVVETIDLVLVKDTNKGKIDNEVIVSNVKIMDGQVLAKNKVKGNVHTDPEESKIDEEHKTEYEDPAVQKEDILNAIRTKTKKEEEKIIHSVDKGEIVINNEIPTYTSSEIITTTKVKKKKDKKTKEENKKKKLQKTKEILEKKKQREDKKKLKQQKGEEGKVKKSNCNKPKYAAKNPEECKGLQRMNSVLVQKCKKDKYKKKHKERCKDLEDFTNKDADADQSVLCEQPKYRSMYPEHCSDSSSFVLEDVRCKKEAFRRNYPELCTSGNYEDDILMTDSPSEDPDWLQDRCKHNKFRERHRDLCSELCEQDIFAKLYRDICQDNQATTTSVESPGEDQSSLIENVINDIKDIVSKETTRQTTESKINAVKTTTSSPLITTEKITANEKIVTTKSKTTTKAVSTTTSKTTTTSTTTTTTTPTTSTTITTTTTTTTTTTPTTTTSPTSTTTTFASTTTSEEITLETTPQTTPKPSTSDSVVKSDISSPGEETEETGSGASENLPRKFSEE